jgi:hypothetical protein
LHRFSSPIAIVAALDFAAMSAVFLVAQALEGLPQTAGNRAPKTTMAGTGCPPSF